MLILGGTTEGYALAETLHRQGRFHVISSLAGRTAKPRLPVGESRVGGFGGAAGLAAYLTQTSIAAIIDATHPFARQMGWNAAQAAQQAHVPLLRLERPAWVAGPDDRWVWVETWPQAAAYVAAHSRRVLLTIGRQELAPFTACDGCWFLIRSVDPPQPMPAFAAAEMLLARGPFTFEAELDLLKNQGIDAIVCKNSGGTATDAKLAAARQLGITVVIQQRPPRPHVPCRPDVDGAVIWANQAINGHS